MRDYTREYNLFKLKHPFIKFFSIQDRPDTIDWFDQDTKERAKKNYTPEWKYATKRVEYHVNSDGYRTKEWNDIHWAKSIVLMGCSYVYGVGVAEDETISHQLEDKIGHPVINMGVPGSSPTFTIHNLSCLLSRYNPKGVVIGWPGSGRAPYYSDEVIHCGNWAKDIAGMGLAWRYNKSHGEITSHLCRQIAQQLCHNTSYADFTLFRDNQIGAEYIPQVDYGRDMAHAGSETYNNVADYVAGQLVL
mgnify:FL=1